MENKADVKAIMARFQASGASTDEPSSTPVGRPKQPLHPTLSSGPTVPSKKPVSESLSGSAINLPAKPSYLKTTPSTKSDTTTHEPNKTKALANRFANNQDDTNTTKKPFVVNKQHQPVKPTFSQTSEAQEPAQKPPVFKPSLSATSSDSKPAFPKPSSVGPKPSWVKEDNSGGAPANAGSTPPIKPSAQLKPNSSVRKLWQQNDGMAEANTDTANKPPPPVNSTPKPSNFRTAQNLFNKEKDIAEETDDGPRAGGAGKQPLTTSSSIPPPKPLASKKPSLKKPVKPPPTSNVSGDPTSGPKRNPLPNSLALGPAPAKPNRPPKVNLESFKRGTETSNEGPATLKKPVAAFPGPPPGNNNNQGTPPQPPVPSLPPRHPGPSNQQEEFYDDVDELISAPPPLPPSSVHPSQRGKAQEEEDDDDDDGEMYEDLDERWEAAEQKQEKKKDKEEKKRLEAEKKEQKEREKKEQDARKKFKLVGSLEVIHQGKARVDCKGTKTDLCLKQGDGLDIIRVQGNPEGKWLGRTQDGSIGYVKTTAVEIDFNSLKNRQAQQPYEPEVYDDIDVVSSDNSGTRGPGVVLPPPPGDGEIYDDVIDPNLEIRVPPPTQFSEANSDQTAIDEEIYDDVDSQNAPLPPPISSLPPLRGKDMDPKKQKKFEKEEKDFRKKFKYDGEIRVLYQVTIIQNLTNKKWSGKELSVKAGEKLDVIAKAADNKLICRNDDGKFGYVSTCYILSDDGDIYDDIGDDCIYDND
ncbi:FYN-binding protein 1 isoform X2 [Sphaeramia orbicularis]|uniref:FYN-binding protein 1 n=1 Tax=Sphaeramia orbicularis TaxID=375764 RepID=A0A673BEW0_9TELE|nr:FYN-binding protein 1-like isoform X2 [Sphaeramia orbicularis]